LENDERQEHNTDSLQGDHNKLRRNNKERRVTEKEIPERNTKRINIQSGPFLNVNNPPLTCPVAYSSLDHHQ